MSIWRAREMEQWSRSPGGYWLIAEKMLQQGEPLLAFDVVIEGLSILPDDVQLRQLQGLSLARSGPTERANAILANLRREGQLDEEMLTLKSCYYFASGLQRQNKLQEAKEFAQRAAEGAQSLGPNHPSTQKYEKLLAVLQAKP